MGENYNEVNGGMACVKAPVILHQSHFPRLTGPNSPHTASLAAAIVIAQLRAVTFSYHTVFMHVMAQVTFVCTAPSQTISSHLNWEIFCISVTACFLSIYSVYGKYSDSLKFFTLCYIAAIF